MDFVLGIFSHWPEIAVIVGLLWLAFLHYTRLTPTTADDMIADRIGEVLDKFGIKPKPPGQ